MSLLRCERLPMYKLVMLQFSAKLNKMFAYEHSPGFFVWYDAVNASEVLKIGTPVLDNTSSDDYIL